LSWAVESSVPPSASAADRRLKDCEAKLDDYTERVFNALHAT
jgi:ChrB-like protein